MPLRTQLPHLMIPTRVERTDFAPVRPFFDMSDRPPLTARQQRYLHANQLSEEVDQAVRERIELIQSFRIPDTELTPGLNACFVWPLLARGAIRTAGLRHGRR